MPGIWEGVDVLDLSWGIAGPIVTMLLADNGATVTKIEAPGGDPFRSLSGHRVWNRGKRSTVIDLKDPKKREDFLRLAARADVVIESFAPGTTKRLGIDYETLSVANPRLVYCSITGYGATGPDADRPGYDALVAARTGLQWESRGVLGGTTARLSGTKPILPDFEVPVERWAGPPQRGADVHRGPLAQHGGGLSRSSRDQCRFTRPRGDRARTIGRNLLAHRRAGERHRRVGSARNMQTPPATKAGSTTPALQRASLNVPTVDGCTSGSRFRGFSLPPRGTRWQ